MTSNIIIDKIVINQVDVSSCGIPLKRFKFSVFNLKSKCFIAFQWYYIMDEDNFLKYCNGTKSETICKKH